MTRSRDLLFRRSKDLFLLAIPAMVLASIDLVLAWRADRDSVGLAFLFLAYALPVALAAIPTALLVGIARGLLHRVTPVDRSHPVVAGIVAGFGAFLVLLNRDTFGGARIARHPLVNWFEGTFILVALLGLWWLATRLVTRGTGPGRRVTAAIFLVLAIMASLADRVVLPGLYPNIHLQLFLVAMIAGAVATRLFLGPSSKFVAVIGIVTLILGVAGAFVLRQPKHQSRLGALLVVRGLELPRLDPILAPVLRAIGPTETGLDVDVSDLLVRRHPESTRRAIAARRKIGPRPDVVLVSFDTVRADRCGFLGFEKHPTTPRWDALAERSIVFERAYTAYPASGYSFSSMFTSTWPAECPQRRGGAMPDGWSLASLLRRHGYRTAGATDFWGEWIKPGGPFGTFGDGFDDIESFAPAMDIADAASILAGARAHLEKDRTEDPRPLFLWVHFFDAHGPFIDHAEFGFGSDTEDRYASEIAYVDRHLGELLDAIGRGPKANDTIVVVHSDHGQSFGEHGTVGHISSLYNEQIHVPMTITVPGGIARRCAEPVSLLDIVPTLVTLADLDDPHEARRRGRDLADMIYDVMPSGEDGPRPVPWALAQLLSDVSGARREHVIVLGDHKIMWSPESFPVWRRYDVVADPAEDRLASGNATEDVRRHKTLIRTVIEPFRQ